MNEYQSDTTIRKSINQLIFDGLKKNKLIDNPLEKTHQFDQFINGNELDINTLKNLYENLLLLWNDKSKHILISIEENK